jgi:hypothetical protein
MTILNPDHLLDQAEQLIRPVAGGRPRQVGLRRSISAAYYGVFHATLIAAADCCVGRSQRQSRHYALVYRSIDHRRFKAVCEVARHSTLSPKYQTYAPSGSFGADLQGFASAASLLQEARNEADYDPLPRLRASVRIPTKAATYSNLIAATIPI